MLVLTLAEMPRFNTAPKSVRKVQDRNFLQRLETNAPIHFKRMYRWGNSPLGRYAFYATATWLFPQQKVKAAIKVVKHAHAAYESAKKLFDDVL